mgnify:FL=1
MPICYIVGALPTTHLPQKQPGDLLIAADKGWEQLGGQTPDLVVGDFDSLGYVPQNAPVLRHPVRKDDTDSLLAVREGLSRGYRQFVLLGASGGRLDHTLANIQVLLFLAERGAHGFLQGERDCAAVVCGGTLRLRGGQGRVSVFALDRTVTGVTLAGLDYPLDGAALTDSFPIGVSNAFLPGQEARITAEQGRLLVLWDGDWQQAELTP